MSGRQRARRPAAPAPDAEPAPVPWGVRRPSTRIWLAAGLLATLLLLLSHARLYAFLTDDAFISFRYARNLAHGHGLVFNPGTERVEGYTNFLWVLLLAGLDRLGVAPEHAANAAGLAATVTLWGLLATWMLRRLPAPGREWIVLLPLSWLAATRSVAVWSTSGLETRLFELLIVAATLRLADEVRARADDGRVLRPWAALAFGLASLTRPDGILLAGAAFAGAAFHLARRRQLNPRAFALQAAPWAVVVALHLGFRLAYYGDWLPNTYYVKVGGRTWWGAGVRYLAAFGLEYGLYLWLPLAGAAALSLRRLRQREPGTLALLVAVELGALGLYVAAIGGDHFEYRPLDLCFFLLVPPAYEALRAGVRGSRSGLAAGACALVIVAGLVVLPWQSHVQFPQRYSSGFPGLAPPAERRSFLDPDRSPLTRLPGVRAVAGAHAALLGWLSGHYVGIRQEEHRLFLASVEPQGKRLRALVEQGVLPRDTYLVLGSVGAVPYYSDLRTLDLLGLTDAHVAHSQFQRQERAAHDKSADWDYARRRGVDLWIPDAVHPLWYAARPGFLDFTRAVAGVALPTYAARTGAGEYLIAGLPLGAERAARRFPQVRFLPVSDPEFLRQAAEDGIAELRTSLARRPGDAALRGYLADLYWVIGRVAEARDQLRLAVQAAPGDLSAWHGLSVCEARLGRFREALEAAATALDLARREENFPLAAQIQTEMASCRAALAGGAAQAAGEQTR